MLHTSLFLAFLAIVALSTVALGAEPPKQPSHNEILGKPSLTAADSTLKRTIVVATFDHAMEPDKSIIWCSTMPLAWSELVGVLGAPVAAGANTNPTSAAAIAALNSAATGKNDLDEDSCVARAGFGRDGILDKIRVELKQKFQGAASPSLLPTSLAPDEIFAYSYLFKNLAFAEPFIRRTRPLTFGPTPVAAFGLWHDERLDNWSAIAKQVSILSYTSKTQWTVELKTKAAGDRLIIARLDKAPTLKETVDAAFAAGKNDRSSSMSSHDTLIIPLLNYDITRTYHELRGVMLRGTRASGSIDSAVQNIRFRLDERGAVLKSEAAMRATAARIQRQNKDMICDGPFLIVMMRAGAEHPYFAMWIDNPETLVAAPPG